jgi:hypothetical protein
LYLSCSGCDASFSPLAVLDLPWDLAGGTSFNSVQGLFEEILFYFYFEFQNCPFGARGELWRLYGIMDAADFGAVPVQLLKVRKRKILQLAVSCSRNAGHAGFVSGGFMRMLFGSNLSP